MGSFCCWLVDEDMYLRTSISGEIIVLCAFAEIYSAGQYVVKGCVSRDFNHATFHHVFLPAQYVSAFVLPRLTRWDGGSW